jgi:phosphatidylglycerophosphate synthase
VGIAGSFLFLSFKSEYKILGSLLFLISYILDNCDGEVARHKNLTSNFGAKFDTFVDWIVHTVFFSALGYGTAQETGNNVWLWLGVSGSVGGTINYLIVTFIETQGDINMASGGGDLPITLKERIIFIFRELFRADFCFIVLFLALTNFLWVLLPTAAIGAQIYWIMIIISYRKNRQV